MDFTIKNIGLQLIVVIFLIIPNATCYDNVTQTETRGIFNNEKHIEDLDFRNIVERLNALDDLEHRIRVAEQRLALVDPNLSHGFVTPTGNRLGRDVRIAFTASLTQTHHGLSAGSVVVFDDVSINLGNGYSSSTGIFACPANGNYFFMVSLMSGPSNKMHAEIVVDSISKAAIYAQSDAGTLNVQSSNSAVAHCTTGQQVWVKVKSGSSIYGDATSHLTQFTGYLIWED